MSRAMTALSRIWWVIWSAVFIFALWAVWHLEQERADTSRQVLQTDAGPVQVYRGDVDGPLVVVSHGFAGSVQMMQAVTHDLAKAGYTVAAFDYFGHGRSTTPMSADVTRIEGTTQQLVDQTRAIVDAVQAQLDMQGPIAMIGHSMATDIIIRAAQDIPQAQTIVAISMYSDAITPTYPKRLLVLSGAWETRLRAVALDTVQQLDSQAGEGETILKGDVMRRAAFAPNTEHAAVLFSPVTLAEIRSWLDAAFERPSTSSPRNMGQITIGLLIAITVLMFPAARLIPMAETPVRPLGWKPFSLILVAASIAGFIGVLVVPGTLFGLAAIGHLAGFFMFWGGASLALLWTRGLRPSLPDLRGTLVLLAIGIAFALALDRYMAAFIPTGPRMIVMAVLLPGAVLFQIADRLMAQSAPLWRRVVQRIAPLIVLSVSMGALPTQLGLMFTVLPVMILFYCVYGTMAHAVAQRGRPSSAALGSGIMLAWALAASTPFFAGM